MKPCIACQSDLMEEAKYCWNCGESQLSAISNGDSPESIELNGIRAEVSTARIPSGEWVALGSVVASPLSLPLLHPAWVIVGTGTSMERAVDDLRGEMRRRAVHLTDGHRPRGESTAHPVSVP